MTLLLSNDDVDRLLSMRECIDALAVAYRDLADGRAGAGRELPTEWFTQDVHP